MCRNIKVLFNFDPPATENEIYDASLQYVRKISGYNKPSDVNEPVFDEAVKEIEVVKQKLLRSLKTNSKKRDREQEERKVHLRALKRFGPKSG